MAKETLVATIKAEITYRSPEARTEAIAELRKTLREGLGRGDHCGDYSWILTTGTVKDTQR